MTKAEVINKWENIIANKEKRIEAIQNRAEQTTDLYALRSLVEAKIDEEANIIVIHAMLTDIKEIEE